MGLHEERYRRVIEKLIEVRRRLGLSQAVVAQRLVLDPQRPTKKVTQSFVSKCENRERRLDAVELADFARVYGISVLELLNVAEPPLGAAFAREGGDLMGVSISKDAEPATPVAAPPPDSPQRHPGPKARRKRS